MYTKLICGHTDNFVLISVYKYNNTSKVFLQLFLDVGGNITYLTIFLFFVKINLYDFGNCPNLYI